MDKVLNEGQQPEIFQKSDHIELGSDGWLSPSGMFFKAGKNQHKEAAEWIVAKNLSELKEKRKRPINDAQYMENSGLPSIEFLRDKGWILINGPIFRTENALNYTTDQLTKLSEAGIPVVGAYDGSKEFSSQETLEWVGRSAKNISDFIETQKIQILRFSQRDGYKPITVTQDEFWENIRDHGYSTLEDFKRNPFDTIFGEFGRISFTDVRDVLSQGYQDEIVFDRGQETYTLRLIKLSSGERICVEYTYHHHDRDFGNEEHMNVYVVDNFEFKKKLDKYISSGINPKIKGDYFRNLIENKKDN
ncbi:MAG TPA: hypothetical protein VKC54_04710 [Patescibacteria group bacterium]|nr:hypothetical protein [Patescibacteria group bacterium]